MKYTMTTPCNMCPFLKQNFEAYGEKRLDAHASGEFHCHQSGTCDDESGQFVPTTNSVHCAGALIYLEKRNRPHQMMRIMERLGQYDRTKLDMDAPVS